MNTDTIAAIGSLWRLVVALAILFALFFFRKPIHRLINNMRRFKVKRGETEVSVESPQDEAESGQTAKQSTPPKSARLPETPDQSQAEEPPSPYANLYESLVIKRNSDEAEKAFIALQSSETDATKKQSNEIIYWKMRYEYLNDSHALDKLKEYGDNPKTKADGLYWLAACYQYSRNFPRAIEILAQSLSAELSDDDRAQHISALARCHIKNSDPHAAMQVLIDGLTRVHKPESKARIYQSIASVHESSSDQVMRAIALQKALEYSPENPDILFNAAYAESEAGISALCATNYNTLLSFRPDYTSGHNNLGVEFNKLHMPIKAVTSYNKAAELKETLAMSNLAYKYIAEGFYKEAKDIISKAMAESSPHKNVGLAWAHLEESREKENATWEAVQKQSTTQQQYFWRYAENRYVASATTAPFAGVWVTPSGNNISIEQTGSAISGMYETDAGGEEIRGTAFNNAAEIKYKAKSSGSGIGPLLFWSNAEDGFAYVDLDGQSMSILIPGKSTSRVFILKKKKE